MKFKKAAVAAAMIATSGGVAWASCGGTEALVYAGTQILVSVVTAKITAMTAAVTALDNTQTEALVSSLRVATKQIQASGEKLSITGLKSEEAEAAVRKEIADKELVDKVVVDFTSQGFDPCKLSESTKRVSILESQAKNAVPMLIKKEVEAGGGKYASHDAVISAREERHQSLFCSEAEVAAGACKQLGKIPGGDSNAALLFSTDASSDTRAAKNAVINNIIGVPDNPVPKDVANTPEAVSYLLEKKKKDSFLAFATYSLKTIQSENETFKGAMDERVGQYFGTSRATEWAKSQQSQAPRGLMVDVVKIQGMNLKLAERRLNQRLRMEANLAALLELENQAQAAAQTQRVQTISDTNTARMKVN